MKIVTIGGGTGTFTVLSGLKKYNTALTAIVSMADDGGSTGKLRDEFGSLPVGDVRMALVALADEKHHNNLLRELFLYRFEKGEGLRGHNFGNLFLVAMADILGSTHLATEFASEVLRINGTVIPVTDVLTHLVATYEDGTRITGQSRIDSPPQEHDVKTRITHLALEPEAQITHSAQEAILHADAIILGPGDLYTSLLADIVVKGVPDAICSTSAKFVYVLNLMTKRGQTHLFSALDHVTEVHRYCGRWPDSVIINNTPLSETVLEKYRSAGEFSVQDDLDDSAKLEVIRADIINNKEISKSATDVIRRSLIRHDPDKLAKVIMGTIT